MTTALDIVTQALKTCGAFGVGQTPLAEDSNDAFTQLNWMLAQWARKRWLVYHLIDVSKVSTGATSYTVGTGGDFATPRPDRLESAFFRQTIPASPNQIDYPLEILQSREDYNQISLKSLQSFPEFIFYDSGFPLGTVYPWPVPQSGIYEIHLTFKAPLTAFANLATAVNLPDEYFAALYLNLAMRLRPSYNIQNQPGDVLPGEARDALNTIRSSNFQIARLRMPRGLSRPGVYNVYSDQIR